MTESAKEQTMFVKCYSSLPDLHNILQFIVDYSFQLFLYSVSPFLIFHNKVEQ